MTRGGATGGRRVHGPRQQLERQRHPHDRATPLAEPGRLDAVAALQVAVQPGEMAVEVPERLFVECQHQRVGGIAGDAGDVLQGVHRIAFAAAGQVEKGAPGRGLRPGIEEAGGTAVVAA
jgi:hypothetical protein